MPHPPFGPEAFTIPWIDRPVYWYGILVTLGTLAGAWIADRQARRRGHNPDHVWNALISAPGSTTWSPRPRAAAPACRLT
jgi:prolipoprotein diacylglyceryltransferase